MDEYGEVLLLEDQYYWLFHANDSYSAVKLLRLEGDDCRVEDYETEEQTDVSTGSLVGMIPAPGELTLRTIYDDLTEAVDISEASILWNMRKKYDENKIYSSIGPILIALNPYCYIDVLYNNSALQAYMDGYGNQLPPHIWSIAKAAFEQLKQNSHRQAIVISGESGAGKTETTKKCLQYLSAVSMSKEQTAGASTSASASGQEETPIEDRVLGSNPVLESFGNAKTCRNNNSSRFGKWLEINFSCGGGKFTLIGANITQYLLEKSRVVGQAEDERNYHIFYQMCADESTGLGCAEDFSYLNQSGCTEIEGVDDLEEFHMTKNAYEALNFPGMPIYFSPFKCWQVIQHSVELTLMLFMLFLP
jgi:myosin heavy subunit